MSVRDRRAELSTAASSPLAREVTKFAVVGGAGVAVNLLTFNLVRHATSIAVVPASVIATVVSIVFNYVGFRYFAYKDRDKSCCPREMGLFLVFSAIGLLIENGVLALATYGFGWDSPLQSNVFKFSGIALATLFRFWSYRTWVFRVVPEPSGARRGGAGAGGTGRGDTGQGSAGRRASRVAAVRERVSVRGSPGTDLAAGSVLDDVRASLRSAMPGILLFIAARTVSLMGLLLLSPGSPGHTVHRLAVRWDAVWYIGIARHGYDHSFHPHMGVGHPSPRSNLAFFPVYPLLLRGAHTVLPGVGWGGAALLVACACALVAAWGIHAVTALCYGRRVAVLTTVLWGIAPVAVVETAGYSESAFTALAAWALLAVLKRHWLPAAALSVAAGLTRPVGAAVAAAVMAEACREVVRRCRGRPSAAVPGAPSPAGPTAEPAPARLWRPVAAFIAAPLGWLGFIAWTGWRMHDWRAYFRIQRMWNSRFDFGLRTAEGFRKLFTHGTPVNLFFPVTAVLLVAAIALLVVTIGQRQPLALVVYSLIVTVVALGDTAHWSSRGRFLLPAFPLLIPVAKALSRARDHLTRFAVLAGIGTLSACYGTYLMLYSVGAP
ncbi:GtrA family protein [Actinacidiphila acidipaludis]|uniref:GtrA family protein n=1 Tax=Actinacidiphila acidipaludis TaxID=2873382 RepID=A0ABS7QBN6_9ACTN|nr:GtrA family protein [Streptomyces acidipaludis]MBY8880246.1 GtrA family protein [Streptomyces acidipaludis]